MINGLVTVNIPEPPTRCKIFPETVCQSLNSDSALDMLIQDREFREMLIRKLQGLALEKPPHP